MTVIEVFVWHERGSAVGSRGALWSAACEIGGKPFLAQSRSGAVFKLARVLLAAGVADTALEVRHDGLWGAIT